MSDTGNDIKLDTAAEQPVFTCSACGKCCSRIRGMISKEDLEFINEYGFGKLPLVNLVPPDQTAFPLWDWEAKRFKEWQKEVNIDAKIEPSRAILDLHSNKAIVVTYHMAASDACPFLKDKKCMIYDKKRAYICRLFPFNRGPFLKTETLQKWETMFGTCGAIEKVVEHLPQEKEKLIPYLHKAFSDGSFENAVQNDKVTVWINEQVINLMKIKKIKPALNYPYKFLLKRINQAEHIDFTDFLVQESIFSEEEMAKLLKRFDANSDAKELIQSYL